MEEIILNIISSSNSKISYDDLFEKVNFEKEKFDLLLKKLQLEGKIFKTKNKYVVFPNNMFIGIISVSNSFNKVIFYDGKMLPVADDYFNNIILNDTVSFIINDKGEAEITSIIDRKIHNVTCKVISKGKKKKLECFYKELDISISDDELDKLKPGDIISVSVGINNETSHSCVAKFNRIIGHADDPNIDDIVIASNYGFDDEYTDECLAELNSMSGNISDEEIVKRRDFRDLDFITIDCVSAKDMDDAVYGYRLSGGGYRIYVSIADVSHYVKLGTKIFERAYEKGNSCYINNSVFHMLHPILSNDICSLNPNDDKLTKTVVMDIDRYGNIVDFDICKSVIRSKMRMDYATVDMVLKDKVIPEGYEPFVETLEILHEVSLLLEDNAVNKGRLDFPNNENKKEYDEFGNVTKVTEPDMDYSPSEKLIEYLMISANHCVAEYILQCMVTSIYRNHKSCDPNKINTFIKNLNENGDLEVKLKLIETASHPKVIQGLLKRLSHLSEYPILANMIIRHIERAEYSTENLGHYALGLDSYTHFTSPIRRLCDLMVHMVLDILLGCCELDDDFDFCEFDNLLEEASRQASRMERQAQVAEEDGERLAIIKSMQSFIGEEYYGTILDVGSRIRIKINGIDCFIKYKNLSSDFIYDEKTGRFFDKFNNMVVKLGAKVKVRLDAVNLVNRTIDVTVLGIIKEKQYIKEKTMRG